MSQTPARHARNVAKMHYRRGIRRVQRALKRRGECGKATLHVALTLWGMMQRWSGEEKT